MGPEQDNPCHNRDRYAPMSDAHQAKVQAARANKDTEPRHILLDNRLVKRRR